METATARPRLRSDLVYQQLEVDGVVYVDVTDPNSGNTFRFYEVEYRIAEAMNGDRDLDGLVEYARSAIGVETSTDELGTVVSTLADLGYLDTTPSNGHSYELGAAGVGEVSAEPDASEFEPSQYELGAPGGTPSTVDDEEQFDEQATRVGGPVELGDAGASPLAAAEEREPAPQVELGPAGGPAGREPPRPPARAPSQAGSPEDLSFAGLMDEQPTRNVERPAAPPLPKAADVVELTADEPSMVDAFAKRRTSVNLGEDNEPTNLPDAQPDPDDDEDVSVDLSAHLSLDKKQVQDAVRASKVVDVPTLPADLLKDADAMDEDQTSARGAGPAPLPAPPSVPAASAGLASSSFSALEKSLEDEPVVAPTGRTSGARPVEPPAPTKTSPVAAQKPSGGGLKWVLIAALIGVGALVYFVVGGGAEPSAPPRTRPVPPGDQPPATSPPKAENKPKALPSAKLAEQPAAVVDLTATSAGRVAWVAPAGSEVIPDAPVVKLVGYAKWEVQKKQALDRLAFYQEKLDKAKAANQAAAATAAQAKVDEKQGLITQADNELGKLIIKATQAGTITPSVKLNEAVAVGAVVGKIGGGAPRLVATFTGAPAGLQPNSPCAVQAKGNRDKTASCVVDTAESGTISVHLDTGAPFAAGDEVELMASK